MKQLDLKEIFTDPDFVMLRSLSYEIYPNQLWKYKGHYIVVIFRSKRGKDFSYGVKSHERLVSAEVKSDQKCYVVLAERGKTGSHPEQGAEFLAQQTVGHLERNLDKGKSRKGNDGLDDYYFVNDQFKQVVDESEEVF